MKRAQLEHLIRACSTIAEDDEIIIIGSQSILGQFPDAPEELLISNEADVYPRNFPERAELVDGSIGELSPFHQTFGYYAQGVGEQTATLPQQWQQRLIPVANARTRGATGWCLEIHDLVVSKYAANREKDREFVRAVIRHSLVERETLDQRLRQTELDPRLRSLILGLVEQDFRDAA
ncbi:DUF6036 family nucleotidyltransferase [Enhygromyxa salina]|uniref:DUF6036 domain-containing protein n=1 Tax=Enhygromyxa salina TaxID=215803 RepID=A0A2S9XWY5_9BACT|nr:DUF6036 family nucleotidyltransferase [Enhygromyxa salina]PRP97362.1 hypothetical protein ENSA7_67120 [Enhygromyxa salina]